MTKNLRWDNVKSLGVNMGKIEETIPLFIAVFFWFESWRFGWNENWKLVNEWLLCLGIHPRFWRRWKWGLINRDRPGGDSYTHKQEQGLILDLGAQGVYLSPRSGGSSTSRSGVSSTPRSGGSSSPE